VVRDQETLFPSHKHSARVAVHCQVWALQLVLNVAEGRETRPMDHVTFLIGTPPSGQEAMTTADDFCVKVSRELRPVVCEPPNTEVTAEEGGREVDILHKWLTIVPQLTGSINVPL
jgi:hypothetical protein